jgi:two-component system, LytTR family, response regulator
MNTYSAVIIEDSERDMSLIQQYLKEQCPEILIKGLAKSVDDGYHEIIELQPDIVFMDIHLHPGTSFDILRRIKNEQNKIEFEIIFITIYDKESTYIRRALDYAALAYITKDPLTGEKIREAVDTAIPRIQAKRALNAWKDYKIKIEKMLENFDKPSSLDQGAARDSIDFMLARGKTRTVLIKDIVYIEADREISIVHLQDGDVFKPMRHLGYYSNLLTADFNHFIRIHESRLVNMHYLKSHNFNSRTITLKNGETLQCAVRGNRDLKNILPTLDLRQPEQEEGLKDWLKRLINTFRTGNN